MNSHAQLSPSFLPPPPPPLAGQPGRPSNFNSPTASPSVLSFAQGAASAPPPPRYHPYAHRELSSSSQLSAQIAANPVSPPPLSGGVSSAINSPRSPPGTLSPQTHSPRMAMRAGPSMVVEYNPQQWGSRGQTGAGAFIPHSALTNTRQANPEDGLPSPPPPYTPAHGQGASNTPPASSSQSFRPRLPYLQTSVPTPPSSLGSMTSPPPMSASTMISPASSMLRNVMSPGSMLTPVSSVGSQPMNFPPPPQAGGRDRSTSRSRSRFGLSALARGISQDRSTPSHTPEPPPVAIARPRPAPGRVNGAANRMSVYVQPTQPVIEPPSARRSASAGSAGHQIMPSDQPPSYEQGLPPPPPGPPPPGPRTAHGETHHRNGSIQLGNDLVPILSMPTRRPGRVRTNISNLGPVPPTPAGWTETNDIAPPMPRIPSPNTSTSSQSEYDDTPSESSSDERISRRDESGHSFRSHERRDSTVKGLRERRSESRAARDRILSPDGEIVGNPLENQLADLTLNLATSNLNRQGAVKKSRASMSPKEAPPMNRSTVGNRRDTAILSPPNSTTQPQSAASVHSIPPKSLPTPPPTDRSIASTNPSPQIRQSSAAGKRRALAWNEPSGDPEADTFTRESVERHQTFIEKERVARSDRERLELFAEYIVMESRLRRDRYSTAFSGMAGDILDLTRDLWRPTQLPVPTPTTAASMHSTTSTNSVVRTGGTSTPQPRPEQLSRQGSFETQNTSPMSGGANFTPRTDSASPSSIKSADARDSQARNYKPVLSPILSMAMSTVLDGDEPRGRSSSRWWESEQGSVGNGRQVERTKRESKYMGLHREARYNLQYENEPSPAMASTPGTGRAGPSTGEYPPEKVGWHDSSQHEPLSAPPYSIPNTPSATYGLDVSRLVTLPPPYPRHYPALSNAHPDLSDYRATRRMLNDLNEISEKKTSYTNKISHQRAVQAQEDAARVAQMRHSIAEQIRQGTLSYTDAAAAEDRFHASEAASKHAALRKEFEDFKPKVIAPLTALLTTRIAKATEAINSLRDSLTTGATEASPDAPMEEGDERPELLEKLKLLKWLVESREVLHRELFILDAERCDKYRDLIAAELTDSAEIANAQRFFASDARSRWAEFERAARSRVETLQSVVEAHVNRGVQDQLSAFWDICPGLLELVKKIPGDSSILAGLRVSVPHAEIQENPSYSNWPLQYLFSLLGHAEKATYQFIENQVGLWCLHNEVSLSVMRASLTVVRAERCVEEDRERDDEELDAEMKEMAVYEEEQLSRQLKDRVNEVESQWKEALGSSLSACLERVEWSLRETGGWDESLRE
ncbi:hypothetical protein BT63DRAFT_419989 [Microthyrium microscopicum]|uniref:SUZ domain-containing protein n=1 Tax=Microthyrium microscopicum TaxID=703497 RepID=A0A6A6UQZ4_9PEZI|nr:hypothetical protein BT63DRAFT_419989 [Microthyrium microscopicum]